MAEERMADEEKRREGKAISALDIDFILLINMTCKEASEFRL
jgi:hypothetical protein